MRFSTSFFIFFFFLFCCSNLIHGASADSQSAEAKKNKFRDREASDDSLGYPNIDEDSLLNNQCPQHVELRWQTEVSSSIYATPLIADINSDGKLDVVVPSFVHYLEVLEGADGDKMPGWPAFHQSTVHSSPLLFDIDRDGVREIALATYNGIVHFFRVSGYLMSDKLEVPRLKVHKNWYVGLQTDPVDRSHPDVHDETLIQEAADKKSMTRMNGTFVSKTPSTDENIASSANVTKPENEGILNASRVGQNINLLNNLDNVTGNVDSIGTGEPNNSSNTQRRLLEDGNSERMEQGGSESKDVEGHVATVENGEALEEDADQSFDLFRQGEELADEYNYDYDDYVDESMWGDEEWTEQSHEKLEDYVNIDSHILCTPVIADIDSDGIQEMIVAVSYFFDHE